MNEIISSSGNEGIEKLFHAFITQQKETTRRAYQGDVDKFAKHLGTSSMDAGRKLLSASCGEANLMAHGYKDAMIKAGLAGKTINRRLAALRSLVKMAKLFGMVQWDLMVTGVKSQSYRDTRGPTVEELKRVMKVAADQDEPKSSRDVAILRICFCEGLRRAEVYTLKRSDFDLMSGSVSIIGKGHIDRQVLSIPPKTLQALRDWVNVRGDHDGPMFPSLHHGNQNESMTGAGFYWIISELGKKAGIKLRPHALRHSAITASLDGDMGDRATQRFSRHADANTMRLYDDNRQDLAGNVSRMLDELI